MQRMIAWAALVLVLLSPAPSRADDLPSGVWRLTSFVGNGNFEETSWLLKFDTKDAKTTATLESAQPQLREPALVSFRVDGKHVHAVLKSALGEASFDGTVSAQDGNRINGVLRSDSSVAAAYLVPTDLKTIGKKDMLRNLGIKELDQATTLMNRSTILRSQAKAARDPEKRTKLLEEAAEAEKKAVVEVPKLLGSLVAQQPPTIAAGRAALLLLKDAKYPAAEAELRQWVEVACKSAADYGPLLEADLAQQAANALLDRKGRAALAAETAGRADKLLGETAPVFLQAAVVETLVLALKAAGKTAELPPAAARLDKLEKALDREYIAKVPPFKVTPHAGPKSKNERPVVVELFTGAECPPCVAADVAFDALGMTYKPAELVLLQYHLHIPRPDPLTNADTNARAKFYGVRATPTLLLNGHEEKGGGGPMAFAERKYDSYRKAIEPLLDQPATCQVTATVSRVGDKLQIDARVKGMDEPGPKHKLRLLLVEESITFVGGNRLRIHHHVVRAMPGGVDGTALTKKRVSTTADVDLTTLRKDLTAYLDDFAANVNAFPRRARPLDLRHLHVVALVQDDDTREILQAVQIAVPE